MKISAFVVRHLVRISPWVFLVASINEIGWGMAVEADKEEVEGLVVGTEDYIYRHLPEEVKE